jgi:hypothetical protein
VGAEPERSDPGGPDPAHEGAWGRRVTAVAATGNPYRRGAVLGCRDECCTSRRGKQRTGLDPGRTGRRSRRACPRPSRRGPLDGGSARLDDHIGR